jgi:hypothetical protein
VAEARIHAMEPEPSLHLADVLFALLAAGVLLSLPALTWLLGAY